MFYVIFFLAIALSTLYVEIRSLVWYLLYFIPISLMCVFLCLGSEISFFHAHYYPLSVDFVSFMLIHISVVVCFFSLLSGFSHVNQNMSSYSFLYFVIMVILFLFFSVDSILSFFILYEFILVPMVILIGVWGSQSERIVANYYMFLYTLLGSIPLMMFSIYSTYSDSGKFTMLLGEEMLPKVSNLMGLLLIVAFCCKLPIYTLHSWLPKAHVEAPVGGSMVLAGLLLKMGGYGLLRFFLFTSVDYNYVFFIFMLVILMGSYLPVAMCSRAVDVKSFIAFSSISHMCVALLGLMCYGMYGVVGALVLFIGHGIVSPLMFFLANVIYEKVKSRSMMGISSIDKLSKTLLWVFLFVIVINMGLPPFLNFFGELGCYVSVVNFNFFFLIFLFMSMVFTGVVMFYYISKVMKGASGSFITFEFIYQEYQIFILMFYLIGYYSFMLCLF
uniref:NADH-ubiquinone oxidoreductase chain 4 n=1 Tax=Styela plicata TaxID=7726 RepID=D0Z5Q4_STYPL|nr:NADH dehydrogenase subunit 4 [Styela plicata]CAL24352.1 NADH dehydrogenase subunit 4 [Styela plicata]